MAQQDWEQRQEAAFTKWINSALHSKRDQTAAAAGRTHVENLAEDLGDGLILAKLLETLATPRKIERYSEDPSQEAQKRDNLAACFRFMRQEKVELEGGIGPQDVYEGNKTLILSLIWTLIRHYQIRSTGKDTKTAILTWVKYLAPDQSIQNFSSDWNDGVALCALINQIRPDLCPNYASLDRLRGLENCRLGMNLAEENLNIPKLIEPEDLNRPNVDEVIMMTYLSSFCQLVNEQLLQWIQKTIPDQNITNLKADWSNGINLACLVNAINPGSFPEWQGLDPSSARANLERAMKAAEVDLEIDPIITVADSPVTITASKMSDPDIAELFVPTYLLQFQNATPPSRPDKVTCSGEGLSRAVIGKVAQFEVDTSGADNRKLEVHINEEGGKPIYAQISLRDGVHHSVSYTPTSSVSLRVHIKWNEKAAPSHRSPFTYIHASRVRVLNPTQWSLRHTWPTGDIVIVNEEASFEITGPETDVEDVSTQDSTSASTSTRQLIRALDPRKLFSRSRLKIMSKEAGKSEAELEDFSTQVSTSTSTKQLTVARKESSFVAYFTPTEVDTYTVSVTCVGEEVQGSPLVLHSADPSKCKAYGYVIDHPDCVDMVDGIEFQVDTANAGKGELTVTAINESLKVVHSEDESTHTHTITIHPDVKGTHWVRVEWSNHPIPGSPFTFEVSDHRNVAVYLPNPKETMLVVGKPFQFTVDPQKAGKGQIVARANLESGKVDEFDQAQCDEKVFLTYEPKEHGTMQLLLTFNGKNIVPDHFNPCIYEVVDPSTLEVIPPEGYGMLQKPVSFKITGLTERKRKIFFYKAMHTATENIAFITIECPDSETAVAQFTPTKLGKYSVTMKLLETRRHMKGSPFKVLVADPQGCEITSNIPEFIAVGSREAITVDTAKAGPGEISFKASSLDDKPTNCIECELEATGPTQQQIILTGKRSGKCNLYLNWAGYSIPKMPIEITVVDPTKCIFLDPLPKYLHSGTPAEIRVSTKDAGPGDMDARTSQPNILSATSKLVDEDSFMLQLSPTAVGTATVQLTLNKIPLPHLAFSPVVVDASKCIVSSPALQSSSWKCKHPLEFVVDATDAGDGELTVKVQSQKHPLPPEISKTSSSTYTVSFTSQKTGLLSMHILWCDENVPGSPYEVEFHVDPSDFSANGKGLAHAIATESAEFTLVGPESGLFDTGTLAVEISGHQLQSKVVERSQLDPKCGNLIMSITDNKDGTYTIQYVVPHAGNYTLSITSDERPIPGSPFCITALAAFPASNPSKCKLEVLTKKPHVVNVPVQLTVDTAAAGRGCLTVSTTQPNGDQKLHHVGFLPDMVGHYTINAQWEGEEIPGSPFDINVIDPSKCKVEGLSSEEIAVVVNEPFLFKVFTEGAGDGKTQVTIRLPHNWADIPINPVGDVGSPFSYKFVPSEVGVATLDIKFGSHNIPNSPITLHVVDPKQFSITGPNTRAKHVLITTPVTFGVEGKAPGKEWLTATAHGPTTDQDLNLKAITNGTCTSFFVPTEPGCYDVSVKCAGTDITGSPFTVHVVDPSKCILLDSIPATVQVGQSVKFQVDTLAAGAGELTMLYAGAEESPIVEHSIDKQESGTYEITLTGKRVGETKVELQWSGYTVPDSAQTVDVTLPPRCTHSLHSTLKGAAILFLIPLPLVIYHASACSHL